MFHLRRHLPFFIAAIGGIVTCLVAWLMRNPVFLIISANIFFLLYLVLSVSALPKLTTTYLKKHAASADEPVWIIFLVTFVTVIVTIIALFVMVNQKPQPDNFALTMILASVPLGWLTIHMMAAFHYAHVYWQPTISTGEGRKASNDPQGGFGFPNTPEPCGWDFAYYAYVIGMTAQTSDTNVTTTTMRKVTLLHSIISFFFNTVLVAAAVNVAVTLGS